MIRRIIIAIFLLISIFVFAVGVPLAINECYKVGGYITLWNASDVLAYYGSLLGAVTAIVVLAGTIVFTRKQIQRETYIKEQKEKWGKVEDIVVDALMKINPMQITQMITDASSDGNISELRAKLQLYIIKSKQSLDLVKCYLNSDEMAVAKGYLEKIVSAIESFVAHAEKYQEQYERMERLDDSYDATLRFVRNDNLNTSACNHGDSKQDTSATSRLDTMRDIAEKMKCIALETSELYNVTYQALLDEKRGVFRTIYKEIDREAERILSWGYRKGK